MAKICYGGVGGGAVLSENEAKSSSSQCEPTSRAARRRRMEIRRVKFVAGVPISVSVPELIHDQKRHKKCADYTSSTNTTTATTSSSSFSREFQNAIENRGSDRRQQQQHQQQQQQQQQQVDLNELPIPSPEVREVQEVTNEMPRYGKASVCGRRRDMEDAIAVHPSFCRQDDENASPLHFLGVYDGHGCSHVAMKCRDRLHELVCEEYCLSKNRESATTTDYWENLMEKSFNRMDKEATNADACKEERTVSSSSSSSSSSPSGAANCRCELQTPECNAVGSTAVIAVLTPDKIIVSNCGDSRAVLCRNGKAIPLSSDHKPDRPDELRRIESAGGRVIYWEGPRVLGVLAMSRAIGDNYLKPYVTCEPEITITDRTPEDDCLILASDGLWDVVSNETACGVVRMCLNGNAFNMLPSLPETELSGGAVSDKICSDAAMLLAKLALARHSGDNVSVVVVDLKKAT